MQQFLTLATYLAKTAFTTFDSTRNTAETPPLKPTVQRPFTDRTL